MTPCTPNQESFNQESINQESCNQAIKQSTNQDCHRYCKSGSRPVKGASEPPHYRSSRLDRAEDARLSNLKSGVGETFPAQAKNGRFWHTRGKLKRGVPLTRQTTPNGKSRRRN